MLRKLSVVFAAALLFQLLSSTRVDAQTEAVTPARQAKVDAMFTLMHLDQTYGQLMKQMMAQVPDMVKGIVPEGDTMTDAQKKDVADFQEKADALVTEAFSWEALKPEYVKLYAETYSDQELDGIVAFYQSPVGQKMLASSPALLKASSAIAMTRMQAVQPKMRQLMLDFQAKEQAAQPKKSD